MSNHRRRDAEAPSPLPPPPLPPPRQGLIANAASAIARVAQPFGYGSRPSNTTDHQRAEPRPSGLKVPRSSRYPKFSMPKLSTYIPTLATILEPRKVPPVSHGSIEAQTDVELSPISSRSTTHETGIPIAALDVSPDRTHAVLAGHNILRTLRVSDSTCTEEFDLRASTIAHAATQDAQGAGNATKHKDQWRANDVKWSHGQYDSTISTAAANGQIVVYDVNRAGVEIARLHEHNRQVHRLAFNPHRGQLMLSGSQDGTVRLWDLRDLSGEKSVTTCQSRRKFPGNSEGIRDLRWSPTDGMEFAFGTDNGIIQRWDIRNERNPLLRVSAHENKTCYSIDWHPDGKHLVSGGADKNIKIWDFSSSDRRKKNIWEIRAPQAVLNVRWRPACWSSEVQTPARWQCTQIATSYDQQNPQIHIWDLRRPCVPFRTFDRYDTPASALLWRSESLLWSVGSAGTFTQTDTHFVPKTMDHRSPNLLTFAADSQILFFSQKRERRQSSIENVLERMSQQKLSESSTADRPGPESNTTRRSSEEPNTLSSSAKARQLKHSASRKLTRSSIETPSPATSAGLVTNLEKSLRRKNMYRPSQVAGIGYIEGLFDAPAFKFLARSYKIPQIPEENVECDLHLILANTLRHNARLATHAGQHRLSQSLLILALAVERELKARAEANYQRRVEVTAQSDGASLQFAEAEAASDNHQSQKSSQDDDQLREKAATPSIVGNASNMTTPLARPLPDASVEPTTPSTMESLQLLDAAWLEQPVKPTSGVSELAKLTSPKSPNKENERSRASIEIAQLASEPGSQFPHDPDQAFQDASLVDMDRQVKDRHAAIDTYRAMPRPVLRLDDPIRMTGSSLNASTLDRHDSNESYQMFSASTDSSCLTQSIKGSFESSDDSQKFRSTSTPNQSHTVNEPEQKYTEPEESALMFDDEAPLQPTESTSAPSPNLSDDTHNHVQKGGEPVMSSRANTSYRPIEPHRPVINHEDFKPQLGPVGSAREYSEEQTFDDTHKYLLSDFYPPDEKPEHLPPWFASNLFDQLIEFHTTKLFDAQLPSYLFLHLGRWLNHSFPYERLLAVFLHYHGQLMDLDLPVQAAELRKLAGPEFPAVAEYGLYGIAPGGPWCKVCQKPSKGKKTGFCERCNKPWADCPICNGTGPIAYPDERGTCLPAENKSASGLWCWCQDCGHGGHMSCLDVFWDTKESEGACPTIGCLHDCMPGKRRDEIVAKLEKEREETKPGVVSKDEWKVPESAAAQRARGLMGPTSSSGMDTTGRRGALSLAAAGRTGSGGKKVRIVVPGDEDEDGEGAAKGNGKGKGVERMTASAP